MTVFPSISILFLPLVLCHSAPLPASKADANPAEFYFLNNNVPISNSHAYNYNSVPFLTAQPYQTVHYNPNYMYQQQAQFPQYTHTQYPYFQGGMQYPTFPAVTGQQMYPQQIQQTLPTPQSDMNMGQMQVTTEDQKIPQTQIQFSHPQYFVQSPVHYPQVMPAGTQQTQVKAEQENVQQQQQLQHVSTVPFSHFPQYFPQFQVQQQQQQQPQQSLMQMQMPVQMQPQALGLGTMNQHIPGQVTQQQQFVSQFPQQNVMQYPFGQYQIQMPQGSQYPFNQFQGQGTQQFVFVPLGTNPGAQHQFPEMSQTPSMPSSDDTVVIGDSAEVVSGVEQNDEDKVVVESSSNEKPMAPASVETSDKTPDVEITTVVPEDVSSTSAATRKDQ